jgi:tetraacyldisaccharide 4'-kinase
MSLKQHLTRQVERIWWQRATPPASLAWAASIYRYISRRDQAKRAAHARKPPLPLISVGNITAGGSGKTPFVIWLAQELKQAGRKPVVLCRGDGGRQQGPRLLCDDDRPESVGDEAMLLQRLCGCPVIAGRDRVAGSHLATGHGDIVILDDGFQYRQLERRCDIVLIPAEGVGNGGLIPAGPLREPLTALTRADLIVRTGHSHSEFRPLTGRREWCWQALGERLVDWQGCGHDKPQRVVALTGIARPQRFADSLHQLGIEVASCLDHPDHHAFDTRDIDQALAYGLPVVVTGKDAVKLQPRWPADIPLWVLEQQARPEKGLFAAIAAFVG